MKRLLHLFSSAQLEGGGPIEGVRQRSEVLESMGHRPEIACLDASDHIDPGQYPVPIHALGPGKGSYCYTPHAMGWLKENLSRYDVLIIHGLWQHHGPLGRSAARHANIPYYLFTHGMLDPYFKRAYPGKHLKKLLYWPLQHRVLRDARAVLFTCEQERLLARQSFRPYKVCEKVVRYGTAGPSGDATRDLAAFQDAYSNLKSRRYLLFMSRIHPKKGCDLLLEAYASIYARKPDAPLLVMAGPDQVDWVSELQAMAQHLGIADQVVWTGMLQGPLKWGAFYGCEAFVLPSHQENFGIVVAEALACAKPVLISREVNIWREIEQDECGLVAADTLKGTEDLLRRWSHTNEQERARMGEAGKRCFDSRFEIHAATQSFLDAIED